MAMQRDVLERVLNSTPRTEHVAYFWPGRCSAYVFNADPAYDWMLSSPDFHDAADEAARENLARVFREEVMSGRLRYLAADRRYIESLPMEFQEYLGEHFGVRGCLWKRK